MYKSREDQQKLQITRACEAEVRSVRRASAGYRLAASNAKKKQAVSDKRVKQAQEQMKHQQNKHDEQIDEWVDEINHLRQQLEMAMAGVAQTVDPSIWKSEAKNLYQQIRRLKEQQSNLLAKRREVETDLETLRENMVAEGTIARQTAKLARRVRTLERLLKAKSSSVQRLRVRRARARTRVRVRVRMGEG